MSRIDNPFDINKKSIPFSAREDLESLMIIGLKLLHSKSSESGRLCCEWWSRRIKCESALTWMYLG